MHNFYPSLEEYPELPSFYEEFPQGKRRPDGLDPADNPYQAAVLRYNFRNNNCQEQFQIQRNRAAFYWQSGRPPQEYPRFEHGLKAFSRDFETFAEFVRRHDDQSVIINQCAVSYTNRIPVGEGWKTSNDLPEVVTFLRNEYTDPMMTGVELDAVAALQSYTIQKQDGNPARLYVAFNRKESKLDDFEGMELELIVRGAPASSSFGSAIEFFWMAHDTIVTTFPAITTPKMHALWERT